MWSVEFLDASLHTEVSLDSFVHSKLFACSNEVGATIRSQLFCRTPECKEASDGVYAAGCVHGLYDLNMHSSQAHATEFDGPTFALCLPPSGASGSDKPGTKHIKSNV